MMDYDLLRAKWCELMTGNKDIDLSDADIEWKVQQITEDAVEVSEQFVTGSDKVLWKDAEGVLLSSQITASYRRIRTMAIAFNTSGSNLSGDEALCSSILYALEWMYKHRYNESTDKYGNWWDWEIGAPTALNDCVALMYNRLAPDQVVDYMKPVDRYSPDPNKTGANRIWKCKAVAIRSVLVRDDRQFIRAREALEPLFEFVDGIEDGYAEDGSFVQHNDHPYTIGYGSNLLYDLADLLGLFSADAWCVPDQYQKVICRWIHDAYEPLIYRGAGMDMVRGREIARHFNQDHMAGHMVIRAAMRMMKVLPDSESKAIGMTAGHWIDSDTYLNFYTNPDANLYDVICAKTIQNDKIIRPIQPYRRYKQYAGMDRAVKHGNGFAFGISMHSSRIANYEGDVNDENLRGWHTGDGMTYLYNGDLKQFSDGYWATVDPFRLPGTTVLTGTESLSDRKSGSDWVGGTEVEGHYGMTGMHYKTDDPTLECYKSWFVTDDEIVALGAGIWSNEGVDVETIVENRKISPSGDYGLVVNGNSQPYGPGESKTISGIQWAHIEGPQSSENIGYYFPGDGELNVLRDSRSGSWHDVNKKSGYYTEDTINRDYLTMYVDHGENASDSSSYAYVLLPGVSQDQTVEYAKNPDVEVLCNNTSVQAVKKKSLGMTAVNFWTDSVQTIDDISCNRKASVILWEREGYLTVSVSDPTQINNEVIIIELKKDIGSVQEVDSKIKVEQACEAGYTKLYVDVADAKGKTFKVSFRLNDR